MSCNIGITKLPFTFDATRVRTELARIESYRWMSAGPAGDLALSLVSHRGLDTFHRAAPAAPTDNLARCPYLRQVLAHFRCGIGDARARKLRAGVGRPDEATGDYAQFNRHRLRLVVASDDSTRFRFESRHLTLAPGEVWVHDPLASHGLVDPARGFELFITADTIGTGRFEELVRAAGQAGERPPEPIVFDPTEASEVMAENTPEPAVLPPGDVDCFLGDLLERTWRRAVHAPALAERLALDVSRFQRDWRALWSIFGADAEGWPRYHTLALRLLAEVAALEEESGGEAAEDAFAGAQLSRRLRDFFLTGALNFRAAPVEPEARPTARTILELAAQPLVRLDAGGSFDFWNPVGRAWVPVAADDLDLVRQFALPARVSQAAAAAGIECGPELLWRVRWYTLQHLLRPLDPLRAPAPEEDAPPLLAPRQAWSSDSQVRQLPARPGPAAAAAPPPELARGEAHAQARLRLRHAIYCRLTSSPRLADVWIPSLQDFRLVDWRWLWLASALARGSTVSGAARSAGLRAGPPLLVALTTLMDLKVIERRPPRLLAGEVRA